MARLRDADVQADRIAILHAIERCQPSALIHLRRSVLPAYLRLVEWFERDELHDHDVLFGRLDEFLADPPSIRRDVEGARRYGAERGAHLVEPASLPDDADWPGTLSVRDRWMHVRQLRKRLVTWSRRWYLDFDWIRREAFEMLVMHETFAAWGEPLGRWRTWLHLPPTPLAAPHDLDPLYPRFLPQSVNDDVLRDVTPSWRRAIERALEYRWFAESWSQYRRRVPRDVARVVQRLLASARPEMEQLAHELRQRQQVRKLTARDRHAEWLVRFQVNGESFTQISSALGMSRQAVRAVKHLARRTETEPLREFDQGGVPYQWR